MKELILEAWINRELLKQEKYAEAIRSVIEEIDKGRLRVAAPADDTSVADGQGYENIHEILPTGLLSKIFRSAWRSSWIKKDLKKRGINLYHGLSHEIPFGIRKTKIKSVVTIHDLIHERFPEQYNSIDVRVYKNKFRYSCEHADKIIAISKQTKSDIIDFYKIAAEKIEVCYQSCNPAFGIQKSEQEKKKVLEKYGLPEHFFLYVGSVIERKNLLAICKALFQLRTELDVPLVVIGDGGKYMQHVKHYVLENGLKKKVLFLSDWPSVKSSNSFRSAIDFPAIYQSAIAMIYPSFFEGFGIPVLEALFSKLPVITSNVSSLTEAGGDAAYYVDPLQPSEIAEGMRKIYSDHQLAASMKERGWFHAQHFTPQKCAASVMNVYKGLLVD